MKACSNRDVFWALAGLKYHTTNASGEEIAIKEILKDKSATLESKYFPISLHLEASNVTASYLNQCKNWEFFCSDAENRGVLPVFIHLQDIQSYSMIFNHIQPCSIYLNLFNLFYYITCAYFRQVILSTLPCPQGRWLRWQGPGPTGGGPQIYSLDQSVVD